MAASSFRRRKHVVGLTGNIATGKTTVLNLLVELGAEGIDADSLVHQMMGPGSPFANQLAEQFGVQVVRADQSIDRKQLGQIVFSDPAALAHLEEIIHPPVVAAMKQAPNTPGPDVLVLDAIKLIEAGIAEVCDEIWVTDASEETRMRRVMERNNVNEVEARRRVDAQPPQSEKVAVADVVIENNGSLQATREQVLEQWTRLTSGD